MVNLAPAWRAPLLQLAVVWAALMFMQRADWAAMADQWWNISTYNHILLIPLILIWLIWQRAAELAKLTPTAWWPGLIACTGSAFLWLLGTFSGFDLLRHLGAVSVLIGATLTLLGPRASSGLVFPLGYLLFLVPFGDELVPPMQMITTKITIALVNLSAIPATVDGVFINTPAGLFEVAEACSGVKFLIAMSAFAALAAHVCFRSGKRRVLFLAVALIVPVFANGVRAWATIFAAQYVGAERAAGIDHIIYGWLFFGLVIAMVLALFWRHFDRAPDDLMIDAAAIQAAPILDRLTKLDFKPITSVLAILLVLFGAQVLASKAASMTAPVPSQLFLPDVAGWKRSDYRPQQWWEPQAAGAEHRLLGRYADSNGRSVDVFVAVYSSQSEGKEAGGFGQGALPVDQGWDWQSPGPAFAGGKSDYLLGPNGSHRLAVTYYRTGGLLTGSNLRLKLANTADKLLLRPHPTATLILSTEGQNVTAGDPDTITDFVRAASPINQWIDRIVSGR